MSTSPEDLDQPPGRWLVAPLNGAVNLASLGLLVWGVTEEAHPSVSGPAAGPAALALTVAATAAWLGWLWARGGRAGGRLHLGCLVVVTVSGGALAAFAPVAVVYCGVGALALTAVWPLGLVGPVVAAGPAATLIAAGSSGHGLSTVLVCVAAALTGTVVGISRRDTQERSARVVAVELAQGRAELLAARNHLARELHDVLAHTLSATALHVEALDAMIRRDADPDPAVVEQVVRLKQLVRGGLDEARGAVRALREDLPPLGERLGGLVAGRNATLTVSGRPRDLPPEVALALYRVAQEALTNVTKHAPGSTADVQLDFSDKGVALSVSNPSSAAPDPALASTGGGYGLQGIQERMLLIGGRVEAGPVADGWRVMAEVPA